MRGRKPKPTASKISQGNPGRRPLNTREPCPELGIPERPAHLGPEACAEWDRVTAILESQRIITKADRAALAAFCVAYGRWVEAELKVREQGMIVRSPKQGTPIQNPYLSIANNAMAQAMKMAPEFGMTPSSRSRLQSYPGYSSAEKVPESPVSKYLTVLPGGRR